MTTQTKTRASTGTKVLNIALLICFIVTALVPVTGVHIHKLASTLFLLLCVIHTITHRNQLGAKRFLLLGVIAIAFATGLFGMILDQYPIVLQMHKVISIVSVFFLAIHIFVYHKKLFR